LDENQSLDQSSI